MVSATFSDRLAAVQERIASACARVGRGPEEVMLVAVSKTMPPEAVREAAACGLTVFGESRVQEARQKIPQCPGHLQWHMVGHLQTNKARLAVGLFDAVHSVDSRRMLETLDAICEERGVRLPIYLEVNVAGESSKHGIAPEALPQLLEVACGCARLELQGLMTVPPFAEDPEHTRPYFARLRELLARCGEAWGCPMDQLSMGMSHDLHVAVEEGATCVRVGSDLFGARP